MQPADLQAVFDLQCAAYPGSYHESPEALESRLQHGPDFCFVAERAGCVAAYLLAHPWSGSLPALHRPLSEPSSPDHVFLHDLAVHPAFRDLSLGSTLFGRLRETVMSAGGAEMRLVAVGKAEYFWRKLGFKPSELDPLPHAYGAAVAMSCTIPS